MGTVEISCPQCGWTETVDESNANDPFELKEKFCDASCNEELNYEKD